MTARTRSHLPTYLPTYLSTSLPTYLPTYLHACMHTYIHTYADQVTAVMNICFNLVCLVYADIRFEGAPQRKIGPFKVISRESWLWTSIWLSIVNLTFIITMNQTKLVLITSFCKDVNENRLSKFELALGLVKILEDLLEDDVQFNFVQQLAGDQRVRPSELDLFEERLARGDKELVDMEGKNEDDVLLEQMTVANNCCCTDFADPVPDTKTIGRYYYPHFPKRLVADFGGDGKFELRNDQVPIDKLIPNINSSILSPLRHPLASVPEAGSKPENGTSPFPPHVQGHGFSSINSMHLLASSSGTSSAFPAHDNVLAGLVIGAPQAPPHTPYAQPHLAPATVTMSWSDGAVSPNAGPNLNQQHPILASESVRRVPAYGQVRGDFGSFMSFSSSLRAPFPPPPPPISRHVMDTASVTNHTASATASPSHVGFDAVTDEAAHHHSPRELALPPFARTLFTLSFPLSGRQRDSPFRARALSPSLAPFRPRSLPRSLPSSFSLISSLFHLSLRPMPCRAMRWQASAPPYHRTPTPPRLTRIWLNTALAARACHGQKHGPRLREGGREGAAERRRDLG